MIRFLLLWLLSIVLWFSASAQSDSCYVRLGNYTGINTEGYQSELNAASCDLISAFPVPYRDSFRVFDYGYYRIPNDINGAESVLWDNALLKAKAQKPYCLLFGRKIDDQGKTTRMLLDIRLPASMFSSSEQKYIKNILNDLASVEGNESDHTEKQKTVIKRLIDFVKTGLNSNLFLEDQSLFNLGFDTLPGIQTVKDSGNISILPMFLNYARVYIKDDLNPYNSLQTILQTVVNNESYNMKIILTRYDNALDGNFNNALGNFEGDNSSKVIVWMHLQKVSQMPDGSWKTRIFFRLRSNISLTEAQAYVNDKYQLYQEQVYNGTYTAFDGKDPHSRDAPSTCFNVMSFRAKTCIMDANSSFLTGLGCGVLDAVLDNAMFIVDMVKGLVGVLEHVTIGGLMASCLKSCYNTGNLISGTSAFIMKEYNYWRDIKNAAIGVFDMMKKCYDNQNCTSSLIDFIAKEIKNWFGQILESVGSAGYFVGKTIGEIALTILTDGGSTGAKIAKFSKEAISGLSKLRNAQEIANAMRVGWGASKNKIKKLVCTIVARGCFVAGTPVLMAGTKTLQPIEKVQLLDYVVAHKNVNITYGMTASDDIYTGLLDRDPYTSDQQRQRDRYELNDKDWHEVVFEQTEGTSKCKLALHIDWIKQRRYVVDSIVNMNLTEQGISGLFRIISIKHIVPLKKPIDETPDDEWEYQPVTGLFEYISEEVQRIGFDKEEELGVTYNHPVYSTTRGGWRTAGTLYIGEKVLTLYGESAVSSHREDHTKQCVYNLEVKNVHNFLVGKSGIMVHNSCWKEYMDSFFPKWTKKADPDHQWVDYIKESNLGDVKERQQLNRLGAFEKKRMTILTKDKTNQDFPGIDALTETGRPISLKVVVGNENTLKNKIKEMGQKGVNAQNGSIPQLVDIDGMITAKGFTKNQIKSAIDSQRLQYPQYMSIVKKIFIEGSDGSEWY